MLLFSNTIGVASQFQLALWSFVTFAAPVNKARVHHDMTQTGYSYAMCGGLTSSTLPSRDFVARRFLSNSPDALGQPHDRRGCPSGFETYEPVLGFSCAANWRTV